MIYVYLSLVVIGLKIEEMKYTSMIKINRDVSRPLDPICLIVMSFHILSLVKVDPLESDVFNTVGYVLIITIC